jgi:hypothetical protein
LSKGDLEKAIHGFFNSLLVERRKNRQNVFATVIYCIGNCFGWTVGTDPKRF